MTQSVVIATRESRLALWQAEHVRELLQQRLGLSAELLGMTTRGALLTVALATFCTGISAVLLYPGDGSTASDMVRAAIVVAQAVAILTLVVLLERASRRKDVSGRQKK